MKSILNLLKKNSSTDNALASIKEKLAKTEARNWYSDRYQHLLVQRNVLALVSLAALIGIVFSAFVVLQISKNKSIEPFILEIEDRSGIVNVVRPQTIKDFTANEILKSSLVTQYLRGREEYTPIKEILEYNYRQVVRLMSSPTTYREFASFVSASNPESPINKFGARVTRTVKMKSIQYLDPKIAQARFVIRQTGDGNKEEHKIAIIRFDFLPLASFNFDERVVNPLGFQVLEYKVDDEIVLQPSQQTKGINQ